MDHAVMQQKTLFISAGHSHRDPGACGNGYTEADIVLEFRDLVFDALKGKVLTATDGDRGENMPLPKAVEMAAKFDIAVELHVNAATPAATGVETLSRPSGYPLGEELCKAISATLGIPNRGAKPEGSGQHSRLAFVSDGGGIIVELFFITNTGDVASYQKHRRALAVAVARVLMDHVSTDGAYE